MSLRDPNPWNAGQVTKCGTDEQMMLISCVILRLAS
jgi:hypothetical protein